MAFDSDKIKQLALKVLDIEAQAIRRLQPQIDDKFIAACHCLIECRGRIILIGIGKSGHIANKISSTLSSTGSKSFYLHPAEASHGDLGMIDSDDVAIIISYSGETAEINTLLPALKSIAVKTIALTGAINSTLARAVDVCLNTHVEQEACPLGLAPTASTVAALAMGDALAIALLQSKGFTTEDFARSHPGGYLGRKLLLKVADLMRTGDAVPKVLASTLLIDALYEISAKGMGMTLIISDAGQVVGVFTDGDLRRALNRNTKLLQTSIAQLMTHPYQSVVADTLAVEALQLMQKKKVNALPVFDLEGQLLGAINMHDLIQAGLV
ncbi:MAG: KpsF/GutQ family sugar-phosphate isomerase [Chromatiales bacterium]|nr:KpsF/GutQ family sugar-phosphate isomerase [Chromatiales bacterium]